MRRYGVTIKELAEDSGVSEKTIRRDLETFRAVGFPLEEIVARVDAVTVERARAAGRALISRGRLAIAALGPGNGLDSAASISQGLVRAA